MIDRTVSHGYLHLTETVFQPFDELPNFDIFIFCHSWERRSVELLKRLPGNFVIIKISFENGAAPDCDDRAASELLDNARSEGRFHDIRLESSLLIQQNCVALHRALVPLISVKGLRVSLDISSLPKAYTLSIIGWSINERCLPSLKLLYSEGVYEHNLPTPSDDVANIKLARFTSSPWTLTSIPYLEGDMSTSEGNKLIAFCGGDHQDILSVLSTYEHLDRWAIITSEDPKTPDPIAQRHAKSFEEMAGIDRKQIQFANPNSAIDALVRARDMIRTKHSGITGCGLILPFSTKPHAIAAAVISLFDPRVTIMARCPTSYNAPQINASGVGVIITLSDLSSPIVAPFLNN